MPTTGGSKTLISPIPAKDSYIAKAFTEPRLIGYAYAYEQAVNARMVPALTPPIPSSWWR